MIQGLTGIAFGPEHSRNELYGLCTTMFKIVGHMLAVDRLSRKPMIIDHILLSAQSVIVDHMLLSAQSMIVGNILILDKLSRSE